MFCKNIPVEQCYNFVIISVFVAHSGATMRLLDTLVGLYEPYSDANRRVNVP